MSGSTQYLYEYENGKRVRNIGFMKIDKHRDKWVIQIYGQDIDEIKGITMQRQDGRYYQAGWGEEIAEIQAEVTEKEKPQKEVAEPKDKTKEKTKQEEHTAETPEEPEETDEPKPEPPRHTHSWEPVYAERQVELVKLVPWTKCYCCGADMTGDVYHIDEHLLNGDSNVHYGTEYREEIYYETEEYVSGYSCSCGKTKTN